MHFGQHAPLVDESMISFFSYAKSCLSFGCSTPKSGRSVWRLQYDNSQDWRNYVLPVALDGFELDITNALKVAQFLYEAERICHQPSISQITFHAPSRSRWQKPPNRWFPYQFMCVYLDASNDVSSTHRTIPYGAGRKRLDPNRWNLRRQHWCHQWPVLWPPSAPWPAL